ncbi:hypothetical protein V8E52_010650 [Russula decolorans]
MHPLLSYTWLYHALDSMPDVVGIVDDLYRGHSGRHPSGHTAIKFRLKGSTHSAISVSEALESGEGAPLTRQCIPDARCLHGQSGKISLKIRSLARRTSRAIVHFMQTNGISLSWDWVVMHRLEETTYDMRPINTALDICQFFNDGRCPPLRFQWL